MSKPRTKPPRKRGPSRATKPAAPALERRPPHAPGSTAPPKRKVLAAEDPAPRSNPRAASGNTVPVHTTASESGASLEPIERRNSRRTPPLLIPLGEEAAIAFEQTASAVDLWADLARGLPEDYPLGLAAAVVGAFEAAVENVDREYLAWLGSLESPATFEKNVLSRNAPVWNGVAQEALHALQRAQLGWDVAHQKSPRQALPSMIANAAEVLVRAVGAADIATLRRIWTWAYGAPVLVPLPPSSTGGRWSRDGNVEALDAFARAAERFAADALRQPTNPAASRDAALIAAMLRVIGREDRIKLSALRELLLEPTPAEEFLRVRGLPTQVAQPDDLDGDVAVQTLFVAADAMSRAAESPWASDSIRAAAPTVAALAEATVRSDSKALRPLADQAHRYTENKRVMSTHERSVRATELYQRLVGDLQDYERRESDGGAPVSARWPAFVTAAVERITKLLPECVPPGVLASDVVGAMRARLEDAKEHRRLLQIRERTSHGDGESPEEAFARAVVVSALRANRHTDRLAENLFAFQRVARHRKSA